ncbi:hypothetical protein CCR75_000713 [Bremia lactucae]|uniref:Uncharacterized protein n=1 Tax=Bremia lactucae TaxID=4779 RepID=A0A976FI11_BRELC|nr:hypothetical protein CCR75_000713 [Bremia lactucae]
MTAGSDSNDSSSNGSDSDIDSCGDKSDGDANQFSLATGGSNAKDDTVDPSLRMVANVEWQAGSSLNGTPSV